MSYVVSFEQLRMTDVDSVGGKNASLGEMISQLAGAGVRVPGGFATTAEAFRDFLSVTGLDKRIDERLSRLDPDAVENLGLIPLDRPEEGARLASRASSCHLVSRADRVFAEVRDPDAA